MTGYSPGQYFDAMEVPGIHCQCQNVPLSLLHHLSITNIVCLHSVSVRHDLDLDVTGGLRDCVVSKARPLERLLL